MSNPFPAQFDSHCQQCGEKMYQDEDEVYVVEGAFICRECADENGNVCECGAFKNQSYDKCYKCFQELGGENDEYSEW